MRTVHETEALRPSDPVPKSMQPHLLGQPQKLPPRLKFILKGPSSPAPQSPQLHDISPFAHDADDHHATPDDTHLDYADNATTYPPELGFSEADIARGPHELWRLLRRQVHWAEAEAEALQRECEVLEAVRKKEWLEKELLLEQVVKNEVDWQARRQVAVAEVEKLVAAHEAAKAKEQAVQAQRQKADEEAAAADIEEDRPIEDQREAAAVLASLVNG